MSHSMVGVSSLTIPQRPCFAPKASRLRSEWTTTRLQIRRSLPHRLQLYGFGAELAAAGRRTNERKFLASDVTEIHAEIRGTRRDAGYF